MHLVVGIRVNFAAACLVRILCVNITCLFSFFSVAIANIDCTVAIAVIITITGYFSHRAQVFIVFF